MKFKKYYDEIYDISKDIYINPELGYKEFRTSSLVKEYVEKYYKDVEFVDFARTGFKFSLGSGGKDLNMAFIAELDAVYAPSHFHASKESGAAHNCGHYSQVGIALALFRALVEDESYKDLDYSISFVFVPAEEYVDLDFRDELKQKGEIEYFGGKPEAMRLGVFDEFDFSMCVHAMGGDFEERTIEINSDLAGFLYKRYSFLGEASHAGLSPFTGVNAYSMSTLFNVALGLGRQQIDEKEIVRVNPIVMETDMSTNVVPNRIKVGTDVRTHSLDYMKEIVERLDNMARGSAMSLGGEVEVETEMGYLPFLQDRYLTNFVHETFKSFEEIPAMRNNNPISAAGDIGDLSVMMPCMQVGYSGFAGTIHGDDFIEDDPEFIFEVFPRFIFEVLKHMSGKLDKDKMYKSDYSEYKSIIEGIIN